MPSTAPRLVQPHDLAEATSGAHGHSHGHGDEAAGEADTPKRIYVYSPSGAVRDRVAFRRGVRRLAALGHTVEVDADALARDTRFAGDDATRVAAIHRAADSGADLALISRGSYGLTRILPAVDWQRVAAAVQRRQRPTRFVGLSDFTAFQCALFATTGATSWAGPALGEDFGVPEMPDDIMEACFDDLLHGRGEGAGWRVGKLASDAGGATGDFHIDGATLWGGNLSVLAALVGTPYLPQVPRGVLYLEDVNEHPFRTERMLTQLMLAGVLQQQVAVLFGQFTGIRLAPHDRGFNLRLVIDTLRRQLDIPVLTNLPFGHVPTKVLLPFGARVSLTLEERDALLYWGHL